MTSQAAEIAANNASTAKIPTYSDKVWKDECMLCFCSPFSTGGLYTSLTSFQSFCSHHIHHEYDRTKTPLWLHHKSIKIPIEDKDKDSSTEIPDKLAIGVPGGFNPDAPKYTVEDEYSLAVFPDGTLLPLDGSDIPDEVLMSIAAIQSHDSAATQAHVESWQEELRVSKYADTLEQLPCTRKVPMDPKQWKCDETGVTENLWLNLSTGFIGSGRPHFDGTGGNGAALRHFEATGKKYPLAVKLGTITPKGADVYSYAPDEDDMVLDPHLAEHLAHWGINILQMEKTEKTIAELQVEKNLSYEFDKITEAGSELQPLSGQGYVGLKNLGNSCYMNSVLQVLWTLPELSERFVKRADEIFKGAPRDYSQDVLTQFTKVGVALAGDASKPAEFTCLEDNAVTPLAFKSLIGQGHPEFSSARQQDAQEYFSYLLDVLTRSERSSNSLPAGSAQTSKLFEFGIETRVECLTSHRVSYKTEKSTLLSLEIPVEAAVNKAEVDDYNEREQKRQKLKPDEGNEDIVLPKVPFDACLQKFGADEVIEDYFSAFLKANSQAKKTSRFSSFPPYLMVHLRRYYVGEDWTPKKLEALVDMPDTINLSSLRGTGQQPGEELQPDGVAEPEQTPNAELVAQLTAMGFPEDRCKRAALKTGNSNVEAAMEWLLTNDGSDEADSSAAPGAAVNDPEAIASLESMGFTSQQANKALSACQGDVARAVDWLFSRADELDSMVIDETPADANNDAANDSLGTDSPDYELVGFISHIGKNTGSGHYVCHIKKDGRWAIFNDEKVAVSGSPPLQLGYMYLYKQK